jgi:2-phospho-L-lactate transferase/gluconeogenesis factor (CofD/UPF0052 family)
MINNYRHKKAMKVIEDRIRGNNTIDLLSLDDRTLDDAIDICERTRSTLERVLVMYESSQHVQRETHTGLTK